MTQTRSDRRKFGAHSMSIFNCGLLVILHFLYYAGQINRAMRFWNATRASLWFWVLFISQFVFAVGRE